MRIQDTSIVFSPNVEWDHRSSHQYHKGKLRNISTTKISNYHKEKSSFAPQKDQK